MAKPGPEPMGLVDFHCRLFPENLDTLKAVAESKGVSVSGLLRAMAVRLNNPQSMADYLALSRAEEQAIEQVVSCLGGKSVTG
jgi:hypothetical protein